jgi:hypothetical protein
MRRDGPTGSESVPEVQRRAGGFSDLWPNL